MANDCLVTKLKGVVDNDNLLKIGECIINVNRPSGSFTMTIGAQGEEATLTMMDGKTVNVNGAEVTTASLGTVQGTFPEGNYRIKISGKYNLNAFADYVQYGVSGFKIPTEMIAYSDLMVTLGYVYIDGDIADLKNLTHLQAFNVYDISGVVADLATLMNNNNASLNSFMIVSSNFGGNLVDLGAMTPVANGMYQLKTTQVAGDLRDLVNAWRSRGITELDTMFILYSNQYITFGEYSNIGTNNRQSRLKFTASTLVWQDGTDAQVADSSVNIDIYAQGVSASQISTWESQGNTVHVIE